MLTSSYVLPASPESLLVVSAKRYQADSPRHSGYTVVFLHATGLHKETFEPLAESLMDISAHADAHATVREIWAVDCPNHGESAVLNEAILQRDYAENWDGFIWPRMLHSFLSSCPGGVNLLDHQIVVAGHSFGGNAAVLLTTFKPSIKLTSIILLDGTIGRATAERNFMDSILTQIVWSKLDVWRSREDAAKWLGAAPGIKTWDPRAVQSFVTHALRTHPASKYTPPYSFKGVTLACKKEYEASCYRSNSHHDAAFEQLQTLYAQGFPVHLIFSKKDEFNGAKLKETQLQGEQGGGPTTVQWIENVTHMFVQQRPADTAQAIWNVVTSLADGAQVSRL